MGSAAQKKPQPKPDDPIPPEATEGMDLPLNDDERSKRVEALRRSLEPEP